MQPDSVQDSHTDLNTPNTLDQRKCSRKNPDLQQGTHNQTSNKVHITRPPTRCMGTNVQTLKKVQGHLVGDTQQTTGKCMFRSLPRYRETHVYNPPKGAYMSSQYPRNQSERHMTRPTTRYRNTGPDPHQSILTDMPRPPTRYTDTHVQQASKQANKPAIKFMNYQIADEWVSIVNQCLLNQSGNHMSRPIRYRGTEVQIPKTPTRYKDTHVQTTNKI